MACTAAWRRQETMGLRPAMTLTGWFRLFMTGSFRVAPFSAGQKPCSSVRTSAYFLWPLEIPPPRPKISKATCSALRRPIEGMRFTIALRQFLQLSGGTPFWEVIRLSKDPTTHTVLAEDAAALAIAEGGRSLSHRRDPCHALWSQQYAAPERRS